MEWDNFYELMKNMPEGINDIFETVKLVKEANITKQENAIERNRFIKSVLQNLYLTGLLIASIILLAIGQNQSVLGTIGLFGFVVSIFLGIMMIFKK
jgi:ubiquinone biosynthesis protein